AVQCATTAWMLSGICSAAALRGGVCDTAATRAAINSAHAAALNVAEDACVDTELPKMGFSTILDVDADVDIFCQQLEDAMVSAVYGPATHGGVIGAVDDTTAACIAATATVATRMLRFAFRERQHT